MYLTIKQQLNHLSKTDYETLKELSHYAKNLANQAIYNIRQHYFNEGKYLSYYRNYKLLKDSPNYRALNSNMGQQIIMDVDESFQSFFAKNKLAKQGKLNPKECKIPKYLDKDGYKTLIIGQIRINGHKLTLPFSNSYKKEHKPVIIKIPCILIGKTVKEISIIPKYNARFFEIHYTYEVDDVQRELNINNALAIDLGVNNLVTAVTNTGKSFIIDGKKLKSINQFFNKENARLQSIKDKQKFGDETTKRQKSIAHNRRNKIEDYMSKTARKIINYCIENNIGTLVLGYNKDFQKDLHIKKKDKQNFVNIPYGLLRKKLIYLCKCNNINYIEQEESYTSKSSFWDKDIIPIYNANNTTSYKFSGKRTHRGLYKTLTGKVLNADINGALNIMRKCNVVDLSILYARGEVDTPMRIRIA